MEHPSCIDDFPSYKPPFVGDFRLPHFITGRYRSLLWIIFCKMLIRRFTILICYVELAEGGFAAA